MAVPFYTFMGMNMQIIKNKWMKEKKEILCVETPIESHQLENKNSLVQDVFHKDDSKYGVAIDLGTTTIVVALYDLETKVCLQQCSQKNRQSQWGSDVMMRLMHCQQGREEKLHQMVINQIETMITELIQKIHHESGENCNPNQSNPEADWNKNQPVQATVWNKNQPAQAADQNKNQTSQEIRVKKIVSVGNTTMCHIFLNEDTSRLAGSPFKPAYQGTWRGIGKQIGMSTYAEAEVIVLPGVDAHVGADAVSAGTEQRISSKENVVLIDIGTNAEMILSEKGAWKVCSTPAGPAFEGMEIQDGMRGEKGAICGYHIAKQTGNILIDVLTNKEDSALTNPLGICGSGLVDIVAALVKSGVVQQDGYLLTAEEAKEKDIPKYLWTRLRRKNPSGLAGSEENYYVVAEGTDYEIQLTQEDIRQFQLAKASVQAGLKVLLLEQRISLSEIDQILIAGVFGSVLSIASATAVGLLPSLDQNRIQVVGNAARRGAALALLDEGWVIQMEQNAVMAEHVELAQNEDFQKEFLAAMSLRPWEF